MKMKDYIGHLVDVPCSDDPIDLGGGRLCIIIIGVKDLTWLGIR